MQSLAANGFWCIVGLNFGPLLSDEPNKRQSPKLERTTHTQFPHFPKLEGTRQMYLIGCCIYVCGYCAVSVVIVIIYSVTGFYTGYYAGHFHSG